MMVPGQYEEKSAKPYLKKNKLGMVTHICNSRYIGDTCRRIEV
jgi:hypothetical protein